MANPISMLERSAVSDSSKRSTAGNEIVRRIKNHSLNVSRELVEGFIAEYIDCRIGMGYSKEWREKVLASTIKGYVNILKLVAERKSMNNREEKESVVVRRCKMVMRPTNWYKNTRQRTLEDPEEEAQPNAKIRRKGPHDDRIPEGGMFVPSTLI